MDPFGSVTVPLSVAVLVCPSAVLKANRRRQTLARKIYGNALLCMIDPLQKLIHLKLISGEIPNEATDLRKYNYEWIDFADSYERFLPEVTIFLEQFMKPRD
jgi:hypothetical protein